LQELQDVDKANELFEVCSLEFFGFLHDTMAVGWCTMVVKERQYVIECASSPLFRTEAVLLVLSLSPSTGLSSSISQGGNGTFITAVAGDTASLPCLTSRPAPRERPSLILWFKDNATKPMYSLDVMGRPLSQAAQWADTSSIGRRSTFRTNFQTALLIDSVTQEDEGLYRCRVDYKNSPTKNVKINFTVIVPPSKPVIRNINNAPLHGNEVGPLEVGDDLTVICEVRGGSPRPSVTWWREGSIYDSSFEVTDYNTKITGVRPEDLAEAESFDTVMQRVRGLLKDKIIVGHSLEHDFEVSVREMRKARESLCLRP